MQRLVLCLLFLNTVYSVAQDIPASQHYLNGLSRYKTKDFKAAVSDFTKVIDHDPTYVEAYYQRGRAYYELKYHLQAIAEFDKAVELNPKHPKAYYIRGYVKLLMEDYRGAVADFNVAVEINPRSALAFFYRGESKYELGELDGACIDWTEALILGYYNAKDFLKKYCEEQNLSSQKFIDNVLASGNQKFNDGDYQGALTEYNKALTMDSQYGATYVSRGLIYLILGDNDKACDDWGKAIELDNSEARDLYGQHCN